MNDTKLPAHGAAPLAAHPAQRPAGRVIDSSTLLGPARLVRIAHAGEHYVLRQTRQGKLILTK